MMHLRHAICNQPEQGSLTVSAILTELAGLGVKWEIKPNGGVRLRAPRGQLTEAQWDALMARQEELLAAVGARAVARLADLVRGLRAKIATARSAADVETALVSARRLWEAGELCGEQYTSLTEDADRRLGAVQTAERQEAVP
jgi:hypothetical protein